MSIDIMRNSCLRLRLWFIYFENRVTNYVGYLAKVCKKFEKHGLVLFDLFGKGDAAYYFLRSCSCL